MASVRKSGTRISARRCGSYATRGGSDRCGGETPSIYARHRPRSHLLAELLDWRGIVAVSGDSKTPGAHDVKIAGVIAYYPYCLPIELAAPALILIGDKDDWTPAALCTGMRDRANNEVVIYPGAAHSFSYNPGIDYLGHHMPTTKGRRETPNNGPTLSWPYTCRPNEIAVGRTEESLLNF